MLIDFGVFKFSSEVDYDKIGIIIGILGYLLIE